MLVAVIYCLRPFAVVGDGCYGAGTGPLKCVTKYQGHMQQLIHYYVKVYLTSPGPLNFGHNSFIFCPIQNTNYIPSDSSHLSDSSDGPR